MCRTEGAQMARIAIYARVSTNSQSTEQQLFTLREVSTRTQSTVIAKYSDTISGSTESRPGLDALLLAARQRKFDVLYCYSIDRLGRSTKNLIAIVEELQALKIDLFFYREGIDTTTATGRCVFTILSSVAELERNLIRERVTAGLAKAKRNGKKLGRPSKMNDSMATAIQMLRNQGLSVRKIASQLKVGIGTVYKIITPATA